VLGNPSESPCLEMQALGSAPQDWDPTTGCALDEEQTYDAATGRGTRCTLQDYHEAQLGERPQDGWGPQLLDDVGVEWGRAALLDGQITVEQFVDLNEKVGGWTIDYQPQAARSQGDVEGIRNFYRAGLFSYGLNLSVTPTIDARTNNTADFHGNIHREVVRARQLRHPNGANAQAYWTEPAPGAFGLPTPPLAELTFVVMDDWLSRIEKDTRPGTRAQKVVRNKPPLAVDSCYAGDRVIPQSACDVGYTEHSLPRLVAGMPETGDVLKCQLKPLRRTGYPGVTFDEAQWQRLNETFPRGVCDWSVPGVGQTAPLGSWLSFADGAPGRPLGTAPVSHAFGAAAHSGRAAEATGSWRARSLPATGLPVGLPLVGVLLPLLVLLRLRARRGTVPQ
jgi:hypothetical protein